MKEFYCGLDLGQLHDYTALAVVSYDKEYIQARSKRAEIQGRYEHLARVRGRESVEQLSPAIRSERVKELEANPLPERSYVVRHLERFELGTSYPKIVEGVREILAREALRDNYRLAVDATGVGVAVTDMLREAGLRFKSVTITGGEKEHREGNNYRVPKRDLITRAQVLLQNRRLKVVPTLAEAATLIQELTNFRYKISPSGHDSYEAWREGDHDDLVLALALAVWQIKENYVEIPEGLVESFDIFSDAGFELEKRRHSGAYDDVGLAARDSFDYPDKW